MKHPRCPREYDPGTLETFNPLSTLVILPDDQIAPRNFRLVFLDGLNEVSSTVDRDIIIAADEFARHSLQTANSYNRPYSSSVIQRARQMETGTVLPLLSEEVAKQETHSLVVASASTRLSFAF